MHGNKTNISALVLWRREKNVSSNLKSIDKLCVWNGFSSVLFHLFIYLLRVFCCYFWWCWCGCCCCYKRIISVDLKHFLWGGCLIDIDDGSMEHWSSYGDDCRNSINSVKKIQLPNLYFKQPTLYDIVFYF